MSFDFKKLTSTGTISSITDPAALFDALPNKREGYGYLRAVQKTVLDDWSPRRGDRDVVIKTNTGGGKTIVGLLMLQCSLNEGVGPALYLAPDPHLAERVAEEASRLGIDVVDDPHNPQFSSGAAICITTMQTLINGKSRFGIQGVATRQPVAVGTVVIDDAHAAVSLIEANSTLTIPSSHPAYGALLQMFEPDLREQGANLLLDIRDNDRRAVMRVPFWAWSDRSDDVLALLHPYRGDPAFEWTWPLVADLLSFSEAVVTSDSIEIKPPCPPIEKFPSFAEARRRIYLTATLADDSVLVTHFDADPSSVADSLVPESAADLGDRLVLSPQELNPRITHDEIHQAARHLADSVNVVVLVPSWRKVDEWRPLADQIVSTADEISSAVENFKNGHAGLLVIVNRYDGIDLPDDACRVLIIDDLPFAFTGVERREASALRNSRAMVTRQLQRLEQGMGRGVRSRDDRCVVLLIGERLTQLIARMDVADRLSPATLEQVKLSRRVAGELGGATMEEIQAIAAQVAEGDLGFRTLSREALVGVTYGAAQVSSTARPLREAYNAAVAGRFGEASAFSQDAIGAADAEDERLAGWLGETHATYHHRVNPVEAQTALGEASRKNSAVLRPLAGLEYARIGASSTQAEQCVAFLNGCYESGAALLLGLNALIADLAWDNDRTDEAEAALEALGAHIGFLAQSPEHDFGIGSDVLWALGDHRYAVIEAKTGAVAPLIWKKDVNQLGGSANWCQSEYGHDAAVLPIVVHPSETVERSGTPPSGARCINRSGLRSLKQAVTAFGVALAADDAYRDAAKVGALLEQFELTPEAFMNAYSVPLKREPKKP